MLVRTVVQKPQMPLSISADAMTSPHRCGGTDDAWYPARRRSMPEPASARPLRQRRDGALDELDERRRVDAEDDEEGGERGEDGAGGAVDRRAHRARALVRLPHPHRHHLSLIHISEPTRLG